MRLHLIAFTNNGVNLSNKLAGKLTKNGFDVTLFSGIGEDKTSLSDFCENGFKNADGLVFICATGIAVRGIAPFIKDKTCDPAVIVIDDTAEFVISLLSGHIGRANELTVDIAKLLKATPVITTATDNNKVFAVDSFAVKNNYNIKNTRKIKSISSKLLAGKDVYIYSDFDITSTLPDNVKVADEVDDSQVIITDVACEFDELTLVPKIYSIGIGCKKGTKVSDLYSFVLSTLASEYISPLAIECIASIDVKKDERAIISVSKKLKVPFNTFTAKQLNRLKGDFTSSKFVKDTVGTDNVCERSAVRANSGNLIVKKTSFEGMTIAISKRDFVVNFE